jgi:putative thioredoxin
MSDSAYAIDVGRDNFDAVVLQGSAATPVLVDFWAPWCAPCRALAPILDKLAAEMAGRFVLAKLNTDLYPDIAGRYGIRGIPDVKVFVAGEVVDAFTGVLPERELRAFLERVIPSSVAPLVARARAVRETGDAGQALALLADAAAVDAGDEALVFEQAETLLALDRAQDAAAALAALEAPDRVRARPVRDRSRLEALQARTTLRAHARADAAALRRRRRAGAGRLRGQARVCRRAGRRRRLRHRAARAARDRGHESRLRRRRRAHADADHLRRAGWRQRPRPPLPARTGRGHQSLIAAGEPRRGRGDAAGEGQGTFARLRGRP